MTNRDIQGHLEEIYGVEVSPALISQVTDAISEEVLLWQNRPLDEVYPIVYLDAVRIKVRHDSRVINKAVSATRVQRSGITPYQSLLSLLMLCGKTDRNAWMPGWTIICPNP
jgi:transposase-like protein